MWNQIARIAVLAAALLYCSFAYSATCTWQGGTGTWNNSNTASWSCGAVPGTGDTVVFDGTSGGGTVTVDSPNGAGAVTVTSITAGAFTGTLDFNTNNNNVTVTSFVNWSGSGTRTINMGSGTWTFNQTSVSGNFFTYGGTGCTCTFSNASLVLTGNTNSTRTLAGGDAVYGSLTINSNSNRGLVQFTGGNTFASLSLAAGTTLLFPNNTTTISSPFTLTGTSSLPITFGASNLTFGGILSVAGTSSVDWGSSIFVRYQGGGTFNFTNSFNLGQNSTSGGATLNITPPSGGGGGGGGHIIGG